MIGCPCHQCFSRSKLENREVQMRRIGIGITGRADIAYQVAFLQELAFRQSLGIPVQVGIVVSVVLGRVELINRQSAGLAGE